jgi:hypothetical protein
MALGGASFAQVPAAYTVEPFTPSAAITIRGTGVRLRAEPFATPQTPVVSSGSTGLPLTVVGLSRQPDWNWYQVVLSNGQKAFIRSDLTSAPSRGGQPVSSALPPIPVIGATTPSSATPQPVAPSPVASPPPYGTTTYNRPVTPQPVTPQPISPQPVYTPPIQTPATPVQPSGPGNAPISLVPRSTLPALQPGGPADPSGLQSVPPGQ